MTQHYVGVKGVAAWCGVTQSAVSQWISRFPGKYPKEDADIGALDTDYGELHVMKPERRHADLGWLPEREPEWLEFAGLAGYRRFLPDKETEGKGSE